MINSIINNVPDKLKNSIVDFKDGILHKDGKSIDVTAVRFDRILNEDEIKLFNKRCVRVGIARYKYAPEIEFSIAYIKR